jgi:hypothetical protein
MFLLLTESNSTYGVMRTGKTEDSAKSLMSAEHRKAKYVRKSRRTHCALISDYEAPDNDDFCYFF